MKYIKHDENYKVTETAPKNKGSISNYNSESNHDMLIADGYIYTETESAYNGYNYVLGYAPQQPLEELKANKLIEINNSYTTEANAVRATTPEDEVLTWDIQKLEAQAWELDSTVATPFCTALAEAREVDREVLLNKVLEKVYSYQTFMAGLTGKRQKLEDQLDAITEDTEANREIINNLTWDSE